MPKLEIIELIEKVTVKDVTVREYIANRIKYIRKKRRINQDELADKIGLSRASITNIEMARHGVTADTLYKICTVLKCKVTDLFPDI